MIPELHRAVSNIRMKPSVEHHLSEAGKAKMRLEQAMMIFRGIPAAICGVVINALIAVLVAWQSVDQTVLAVWAGCVLLLAAVRFVFWLQIRRTRPTLHVMDRFQKFNIGAMMLNGMLWGMLSPTFAVYGMIGHVFLPFILAGMTAATIVSAGACWRCVLAFNIPALFPMAVTFYIWGGDASALISFVILLYGLLTSIVAMQTSIMIRRAIFLRSKSNYLEEALEAKNDAETIDIKRFQAIIESSRELTMIFSPEGHITYASPAAKEILGFTPEELVGISTRELVHEDDLPSFRAIGERVLSTLGDVQPLEHLCLKSETGEYVPLNGRLSNFLYVPGVEGFVFSGSLQQKELALKLHAAE